MRAVRRVAQREPGCPRPNPDTSLGISGPSLVTASRCQVPSRRRRVPRPPLVPDHHLRSRHQAPADRGV